jgi:hypothetical protein
LDQLLVAVQHRTKKVASWPAWSSELGDLRKLGELLVELAEERRASLMQDLHEAHPGENSAVTRERRITELNTEWQTRAEFEDGDDQVEGPVMQVLNEIDRRSIDVLTFKLSGRFSPASGEEVALRFARTAIINAVSFEVRSSDPGWARKVLTLVSEEVQKGVPRWARFRSIPGQGLFPVLTAVAVFITTLLLLPTIATPWIPPLIAVVAALSMQVIVSTRKFTNWLFPPFEVTTDSGANTGGRRLAAAGALVAAVILGFIVNLLTD